MSIIKEQFQKFISRFSKEDIAANSRPAEEALHEAELSEKTDTKFINSTEDKVSVGGYKRPNVYEKQSARAKPYAYVHRSQIIVDRAYFIDQADHRNIVHYYNPYANTVINKIPEHLTMEDPIFAKPGTEKEEEPEIMEDLAKFWKENRLQEAWRKSVGKAYSHGPCIYYPLEGLPDWYSGPPFYIWSHDEATVGEYKHGHPITWDINPTNEYIDADNLKPNLTYPDGKEETYKNLRVKEGNCVFFDYSNSDDFDGTPYLVAAWDDIIDLTFIKDDVNAFAQRFGNGFLILVLPADTDETLISKYEERIQALRSKRGLVLTGDVDEPIQIDWMSMGGSQIDFTGIMDRIEDHISMVIGFPKRWLLGDQEGAMESSGKDALQVNIKLKALFKPWVNWMKAVLKYHGKISKFDDVVILPAFEMQLSEQEKVELESIKTDTIAKKDWLTGNEKRELDGFERSDEEGMDDVFAPEEEGQNGENPNDKPQNKDVKPTDKGDAYNTLSDILTNGEISVRDLANLCNVAPTTISKMRAKLDAERKPRVKVDILELKTDSVQISNDVWEYTGTLLAPQTKYYEKYNANCILPPNEIERIMADDTQRKTFDLGVTKNDDHSSPIPSEVLKKNAIGYVKYEKLNEKGAIQGKVRIDLRKADRILGKENWIRKYTKAKQKIPMSVARWTQDIWHGKDRLETNIDPRSYVVTRQPRNSQIGAK